METLQWVRSGVSSFSKLVNRLMQFQQKIPVVCNVMLDRLILKCTKGQGYPRQSPPRKKNEVCRKEESLPDIKLTVKHSG